MSSATVKQKEDHIKMLAQPKVCHQVIFNRPTIYWMDKLPSAYRKYTVPVMTPRQEELSQSKKVNPDYIEDRHTGVLPVTKAALNAKATPRVQQLAEPRPFNDEWELNRPLCPQVSRGALTAVPSERIVALAKPRYLPAIQGKIRKIIHGPIVRIARFDELARPRIYTFEGRNPFKVSKAALDYVPSQRIIEISRPVRIKAKVVHQ